MQTVTSCIVITKGNMIFIIAVQITERYYSIDYIYDALIFYNITLQKIYHNIHQADLATKTIWFKFLIAISEFDKQCRRGSIACISVVQTLPFDKNQFHTFLVFNCLLSCVE